MSLSAEAAENISTLVSKAYWILASNSAFCSSYLVATFTALSTTSFLSSFSLVKDLRDSVITSSGISFEPCPLRLTTFFDASVEAKLHDESKVIQRCFDENNDDNKR